MKRLVRWSFVAVVVAWSAGCERSPGGLASGGETAVGAEACRTMEATLDGRYSWWISTVALSPAAGDLIAAGSEVVQALDVTRTGTAIAYDLVASNGETGTCAGEVHGWTATVTCTVNAMDGTCVQRLARTDQLMFGLPLDTTSTWDGTFEDGVNGPCPYTGAVIHGEGIFRRAMPPPDVSGTFNGKVKAITLFNDGTSSARLACTAMTVTQVGSRVESGATNSTGAYTWCIGPQVGDMTYKWCITDRPESLGVGCKDRGLNVGITDFGADPVVARNYYTTVFGNACTGKYPGARVNAVIFNTAGEMQPVTPCTP